MKRYLVLFGIALLSDQLAISQQNNLSAADQDLALVNHAHTEYRAPLVYGEQTFTARTYSTPLLKSFKKEATLEKNKGSIIGYTAGGDIQFMGHYRGNRLKGDWKSYYSNEQLCDSGGIRNDVPDGIWKSWYENGQLRFIRTFDADRYQRAKQDIARRASKIINTGIVNIARQDLRVAYSYLSAAYSFHTLARKTSAKRLSGSDWSSLRQRVENNTLPGNHDYLPPFLECLHHGLYMNFYPDGSVKDSGYYKNGLREGVWEESIADGKIKSKGFYFRGHKSDTWRYFDQNGNLTFIETYNRAGRLLHRKEFN